MAYMDIISPSPSVMALSHRSPSKLPHSVTSISAKEQYAGDTPTFRRSSEHHPSRSPPFHNTHRRQITPTESAIQGFTSPARLDVSYGVKAHGAVPPLGGITPLGRLEYIEGNNVTPVDCDINGCIDKGFFLAAGEWTCYRRNYFSCNCSYTLTPSPFANAQIRYVCDDAVYQVRGFLMAISATVADENNQSIELVQLTPKRDKGPSSKPKKVPLAPRHTLSSHQPLGAAMYHGHDANGLVGSTRALYDATTGFPNAPPHGPNNFPTEHTIERIQFKQATANNGKRRAAQQFYHLCIELWAECEGNMADPYVKVAFKKSARMIVRGRSPGHYSDNRKNSTSNGPSGSAGNLSGFQTGGMIGTDFTPPGSSLSNSGFSGHFESRNGPAPPPPYELIRGSRDMPPEAYVSPEDDKAIHTLKAYQYYPGATYENQQNSRCISMFTHPAPRVDDNTIMPATLGGGFKNEFDSGGLGLPRIGVGMSGRRCPPFEGRPTSNTLYPTLMTPQLGLSHMANIG